MPYSERSSEGGVLLTPDDCGSAAAPFGRGLNMSSTHCRAESGPRVLRLRGRCKSRET